MSNKKNTKLRIANIIEESVVDGIGIRLAVFTQGCQHHCHGCHNPQTWELNTGQLVSIDSVVESYKSNPLLDGVTFSGGEPFLQPEPLSELAKKIHEAGGNVWSYTGYTYEQLVNIPDQSIHKLLSSIDVLVDGPYIEAQRDLTLQFRGSKNQRILKLENGLIVNTAKD